MKPDTGKEGIIHMPYKDLQERKEKLVRRRAKRRRRIIKKK